MKVSIIIPCHNVEAFVQQAVASALAQDHPDTEVVCVDDGSADGTGALLRELEARHPGRLRVIRQENRGATAARNVGMADTTGEWLQFLDADDVLLPDKISGQLALAGEGHGLVVGDYEQIMPNGLLLPVQAIYDQPWMGLIKTRLGTTSANLWRRADVERAGGWSEELRSSQDYELMFRMLQQGTPVAWDRRIRTHVLKRAEGSISRMAVQANWARYIDLRRRMKQHLQATDPLRHAEEIAALEQYIFMALRIVAGYDMKTAVAEYRRSISPGFKPQVGRAITERYVLFHNLLGFAAAERLVRLFKGNRIPGI
jgi:glycosyltransferase involved in cell wall biosynthesis